MTAGGCPNDTDEGSSGDSGDDGGDDGPVCEECEDCTSSEVFLGCECLNLATGYWDPADAECPLICTSNPGQAASECKIECQDALGVNYGGDRLDPVPCEGLDESESCSGWDPAAEVTYYAGVYYVDQSFIDGLVANPMPLSACDDAYFLGGTSWFELRGADSGELLYELGLRDNDVIRSLNGETLESYLDVFELFVNLYYNESETEFTLKVNRGGTILTFEYELQP